MKRPHRVGGLPLFVEVRQSERSGVFWEEVLGERETNSPALYQFINAKQGSASHAASDEERFRIERFQQESVRAERLPLQPRSELGDAAVRGGGT
jgi:hypothetical protein